jgi:cytochrome c oxidase accessory protein FixG
MSDVTELTEAKTTAFFADRIPVYPRSVRGPGRRIKWAILVVCLSVYYLLPWLRWDRGPEQPSQAILLDLAHERFHFFNVVFWPQDIYFLTGMLIMAAVTLFLVTSLFGRVWCGYTCPQTVWTDLFMTVERWIEGDRNERMKRDSGPASLDRTWRKVLKHAIWLGVAFWTGGAWIMYYVDAPTVTGEFWRGTASAPVYVFTALFTATTYLLAGWAREQVCTYMCPWPRFQAAMLDEQSLTVTYQVWRGEPRKHGKRIAADAAANSGIGDCIDCNACVNVCPTGVDIRDGIQLGCINCGLCVDACNEVMEKTHQKPWLITWDTLARQKAKAIGDHAPLRLLRPRTFIYIGALVLGITVMGVGLALRTSLDLTIEHDRAPLFVRVQDGAVRNGYTVKIVNKTQSSVAFTLSVDGVPKGQLAMAQEGLWRDLNLVLPVASDSVGAFRILVFGRPAEGGPASTPVTFTLRNSVTGATTTYRSFFMGPDHSEGAHP